ncbi:MAG: hypothetical protein NT014_07910 [Candidatus Omnitrophica bacterium]|nr:hypothetical protein [Candidatus Omnitrophota bacterium]
MQTKYRLLIISALFLLSLLANTAFAEDISVGRLPQFSSSEPSAVSLSLDASPFTGEASTSVPIQLLPSAGNMQEKIRLAMEYRSGGSNSWAGKGWDLELGYITRINKFGVNNSNNPYLLVLNGQSQEIVSIGGSQYRTKMESHKRIEFSGSTWYVLEKDGTRYDFGTSAGGRWVLTKVTDTRGLYISIDYDRPSSEEIYLREIRYPEGQSLSPYCKVSFVSEDRQDKIISYSCGPLYRINRRLKEIQILAEGVIQKKYVLSYATDGASQTSFLSSVTEYGKNGLALPPTTFSYPKPLSSNILANSGEWLNITQPFTFENGYESAIGFIPAGFDIAIIDINGDTLPDLIGCKLKTTPPEFKYDWVVHLNTGNGFSTQEDKWLDSADSSYSFIFGGVMMSKSITISRSSTLVDMNKDGLPDLVYSKYSSSTIWWNGRGMGVPDIYVRYNTGNGFSATETKLLDYTECFITNGSLNFAQILEVGSSVMLVDLNADGLPDLTYRKPNRWVSVTGTYGIFDWVARLNTGSGFGPEQTWLSADNLYFIYENGYGEAFEGIDISHNAMLMDMNNDGLPDLVFNDFSHIETSGYVHMPSYNWKLRYNTGSGFSSEASTLYANAPVYFYKFKGIDQAASVKIGSNGTLADINNDGLQELIFNRYETDGSGNTSAYWMACYNQGNTFTAPTNLMGSINYSFNSIPAMVTTYNSSLVDVNKDGVVDLIYPEFTDWYYADVKFKLKVLKNNGLISTGLLNSVTSPFGGITALTYASSGEFNNTGSDGRNKLIFTMPLVKTSTNNPGVGESGITGYNYEGGWYDLPNREFRGFRHIQTTDPLGYIAHTYFHQDDSRLGKTEKEEGSIKRVYYTYASDSSVPYFTPLTQLDEYLDAKGKRVSYEYDDYGNVTKTTQWGDIDVAGDEKSILTDYAINSSSWLVNLPSRERIFANSDASGPAAAETQNFYDNNVNYSDTPTIGDLTRVRRYLNTKSDYAQTLSIYDVYGNETSKTDPNSNTTNIEYDADYRVFPITITNALGHIERYTYYSSSDTNGLFGQQESKIDPNANTTTFEYDGLGRKTKTTGPYDAYSTYGSESYAYGINGAGANYKITRTTEESNTSNNFTKIDILDGFERVIQSAKESEDQYIYSYVTTSYNPRGEIAKASLPYLKDGGLPVSYQSPDGSVKWTQYSYDAIGRITAITKPDGYTVNNAYNGWSTTITDENNHPKTIIKDAYNRLINVREKNESEEYNTNYTYDVLDNLALIMDNSGNRFEFLYDTLSRRIKMIDPDLGTWLYNYDNNGNLTRSTDANGTVINFVYDALNRIISKEYAGQGIGAITYNYDEATSTNGIGRRISMQDLSGSSRWNYDKEGRITKLEKVLGTDTYAVEWDYDAMDRVKSIIYPNLKKVDFTYNNAGLTENIDGYILNVNYNALNQPLRATFSNSVITYFDYYPENQRLKSIMSGSLQDLRYEYDGAGNIAMMIDAIHSDTRNYVYDDLDRLLSGDSNTYEYNPIGNIITANSVAQSYSSSHPHALVYDGINTYTYDSCGNMLSGAGRIIVYDAENRPTRISKDAKTTQFIYDGDGKRVKKLVTSGASSTATIYIEDLYEKETTN